MNGCCCVCPPRRGSGWGLGYLTRCHLLQDLGCTTTNSRSISWTAAHSPLAAAAAATDARVEDWTAGPASSINPAAQHHPWLDTPFLLEIGSGQCLFSRPSIRYSAAAAVRTHYSPNMYTSIEHLWLWVTAAARVFISKWLLDERPRILVIYALPRCIKGRPKDQSSAKTSYWKQIVTNSAVTVTRARWKS